MKTAQLDWNKMIADTFGNDALNKTPWIKLVPGTIFTGKLIDVKPDMNRTDGKGKYFEIWFEDSGMDRHLDASLFLVNKIMEISPQIGDILKITTYSETTKDKQGNAILGANGEPQIYVRYLIEKIGEGMKEESISPAPKKIDPTAEINIDDIPF